MATRAFCPPERRSIRVSRWGPSIDRIERVPDPTVDLLAGKSEVLRTEGDVRADGRGDETVLRILKHHPDGGSGRNGVFGDRRAVD